MLMTRCPPDKGKLGQYESAHITYVHQDIRVKYATCDMKGLSLLFAIFSGSLLREFAKLPSKAHFLRAPPIFNSLNKCRVVILKVISRVE